MLPRKIHSYETPAGVCRFDQWFEGLDPYTQAIVETRLDRIAVDNFGKCRSLGQGVYELKIHLGPGYRVYYGLRGRYVVLLCGGKKSTQKKDIKLAQRLWREHKRKR